MTRIEEDAQMDAGPGSAPQEDEAGDPAAAFEALRAEVAALAAGLDREMAVLRRGVEAAFARLDDQAAPIDYSADLGEIVKQLGILSERLTAVEQLPLLRQDAEQQARQLERSGEGLIRNAVQGLERQAADLERIGRGLAAQVQSARDRRSQDVRLGWAVGGGILVGMLLLLASPRFLPFAADTRVAALVMGADRVTAGQRMIATADPFLAEKTAWGARFYDDNSAAMTACLTAAKQIRKAQSCTITVPAPGKSG